MPEDKFIDPSVYFARNIKDDLAQNGLLNDKFEYEQFYVSSNPASELFYELKKAPQLVPDMN